MDKTIEMILEGVICEVCEVQIPNTSPSYPPGYPRKCAECIESSEK